MNKIVGFIIILWAIVFAHLETEYFGGNFFPNSKEELICDITALLLGLCGYNIYKRKS